MLVEATHLVKSFGRNRVLRGIELRVEAGEVVGLAGPNGVGKTTTLDILMGFVRPDRGRVRVLSEDPLRRRHLDRIGWMAEQPEFPPRARVRQLLRFQAASVPTWDPALAGEMTERLAIAADARIATLSRGQKARLALLFALAHRPRLLLLDDPTLGLDPSARRLLLGEILAEAAGRGAGILVSTHLLAEFDLALERLLLLQGGRILLDRPVEELKRTHRRLLLPDGAADPPRELAPVAGSNGVFSSRWSDRSWSEYRAAHPSARVETVGLEEIYVALTGGSP